MTTNGDVVDDEVNNGDVHSEDSVPDEVLTVGRSPSLSLSLRLLYGLNGLSLSLPSTALMYIINTRARIPLELLSVYGAIAFLPSSLKPLYAYLSDNWMFRRECMLPCLLCVGGLTIAGTSLVPSGSVLWCTLLAFLREFFNAWPELLLGVTLMEQASSCCETDVSMYETTAALFQSQAATARNMGSLVADVLGTAFFLYRHYFSIESGELNGDAVDTILIATGSLNILGGVYAYSYHVSASFSGGSYTQLSGRQQNFQDVEQQQQQQQEQLQRSKSSLVSDTSLVILLQTMVILFAMKGPFIEIASTSVWNITIASLGALLGLIICRSRWTRSHFVGLFLVARHAVPSSSYTVASYIYEVFQEAPVMLQLMRLAGTTTTIVSTWSYGAIAAKYCQGNRMLVVVALTTIFAALFSLLDLVKLSVEVSWQGFLILVLLNLISGFAGEWKFLPSVILATTTVDLAGGVAVQQGNYSTRQLDGQEEDYDDERLLSYQHTRVVCCESKSGPSLAMQYGILVSCIDFGDQIGLWLTAPLVSAVGVSRENDWANMDTLIEIVAGLSLLPLVLLPMLRVSGVL